MRAIYARRIYWSSMIMPDAYLPTPGTLPTISAMTNVKYYRTLRGLTQQQLAEKASVSQPHVSRIENGDEGPPLSTYRLIAEALDVSLVDLFSTELDRAVLILVDAYRQSSETSKRMMMALAKEVTDEEDQKIQVEQ